MVITHLRPAQAFDCDAIYETHAMSVRYVCTRSYTLEVLDVWKDLLSPESYLEILSDPTKALWVAEYKGRVQGFFQLDYHEAQLDALYVHPFVLNQGLGTAMITRAEELAAQANLSILKVYASLNSVSFYELNGYESLGDAMMPLSADTAVGCKLMRKYL